MKRKTTAKLLGAALTLAMAGTSAQAMTGTYVDGNRTVYIYHGDEAVPEEIDAEFNGEVCYTITSAGEEAAGITIVQNADGSITATSNAGENVEIELSETAESAVSEDIVTYYVEDADLEQLLAELETVGITSDEESGDLFYEGKSIRWLLDEQSSDCYAIVRVEGGEIDVITVRDADGNLIGVKVAE